MQFTDFLMTWSFNLIILGTAIWILLRCIEKICDITLKIQEYENRKEGVKNHER